MKKQGLVTTVKGVLARTGVAPRDVLVVAVSGGPDSMVLLDLLRQLGYQLVVAHVNHGLRAAADKEEKLVHQYCVDHELDFVSQRVDLGKRKTAIEERARELRYAALARVAKQYQAKWIMTAHTANDQVETVAANWLRGSLVRGLGGMRVVSSNIVRPLLGCWKTDLLAYAKQHQLKYAIDKSNTDPKFTRNRIRYQLLPELRKFNSRLDTNMWRNSWLWQQVDEALGDLAQAYLAKISSQTSAGVALSVSRLQELTPLMQVEVIKRALGGKLTGLTGAHFAEVLKILASPAKVVAKRRLGGGLFVEKSRDKITISSS